MRLVVLGAGATRGASFVGKAKTKCLPPLDVDFFNQLQKTDTHKNLLDSLMGHLIHQYGTKHNVSLERMFITFEHAHRLSSIRSRSSERISLDAYLFSQSREDLVSALRLVFQESLTTSDSPNYYYCDCDYHSAVVEWLEKEDAIISFNYDCLIDHTLKSYGNFKWNTKFGYGFHVSNKATILGYKHWQPNVPAKKNYKNTIKLFKLHGSMHFDILTDQKNQDYVVNFLEHPYDPRTVPTHVEMSIIAPGTDKKYDQTPYWLLWQRAAIAVSRATEIVIIGYSFPEADIHSDLLFRLHISGGKKLKRLIIVNPDKDAQERARDSFSRGINNRTRVITLEKFSDLPNCL